MHDITPQQHTSTTTSSTMYPHIPGTVPLPYNTLPPVSSSGPLPKELTSPALPTPGSKSIFAFWHSGITNLPPNLLRNVIAWHRRFSPLGWTIYLLNNVPGDSLNVSSFLDTASPQNVPATFTAGQLDGHYAKQHTSDLIRFPLILRYGGFYLDVGIMQFGDLDWLWEKHIAKPSSAYDFFGYTLGSAPGSQIVNFAFGCLPNNPLVRRAHFILLKLWEGKTNTEDMHHHPLVNHVPLMRVPQEVIVDVAGQEKMVINDAAMTDYAIQIQCLGAAQHWLDEEDNWDGPRYVREKCWLLSMMDGAFMQENMAGWSGVRQWDLFNLTFPAPGETESEDQALAKSIVEAVVSGAWCLKLGHGFSAKLFGGDTLGMLWRKHEGSDCREGTYAGWLRWAEVSCKAEREMKPMKVEFYEPTMRGRLMG